jgi:hypothetical protein
MKKWKFAPVAISIISIIVVAACAPRITEPTGVPTITSSPALTPTIFNTETPTPTVSNTKVSTPTSTIPPIILKGVIVQDVQPDGQEFYYDIRKGKTGISLEGYTLEITFQGGDGRDAQLFFKDCDFLNRYAIPQPIISGQAMRFNPAIDDLAVNQFSDFTCINAVGAKVFGGVQGIKIVDAQLIKE